MSATPVIVIAGYGPAISHSVATKFGSSGFNVALLSRTQSKLDAAAADFAKVGITAKGFSVDLNHPEKVKQTIQAIRSSFGPIAVLFWNPYGDKKGVLDGTPADFIEAFNGTTTSLIVAVQESLPDLEAAVASGAALKPAILVTGGALSLDVDALAQLAVSWNAATFAIGKASQRKLVSILYHTLKPKNIFAGEVTVMGGVKETPFDDGKSTLEASAVANKFWELYQSQDVAFTTVA